MTRIPRHVAALSTLNQSKRDELPWHSNNPYQITPSIKIAIQHLLRTLAEAQPLLLIFDDVQWADPAFWDLLPTLVDLSTKQPIGLLLSYRPIEMRENKQGWQALLGLDKVASTTQIKLEGLQPEESVELKRPRLQPI